MNRGILDPGEVACISQVKAMCRVMIWFRPGTLSVVDIRGK